MYIIIFQYVEFKGYLVYARQYYIALVSEITHVTRFTNYIFSYFLQVFTIFCDPFHDIVCGRISNSAIMKLSFIFENFSLSTYATTNE